MLLFAALLAPTALAGQVLVVDDDGPADFADLQPAIDAAADGDVLLVKDGSYNGFQLFGKGLTIVADSDAVVTVSGLLRVEAVPAGSLAVLRGLRNATPHISGVTIVDCAGAVRIEECALEGWQTPSEYETQHLLGHGAQVEGSADVWLVRCELRGGPGNWVGPFFEPNPGGHAVSVESSTIAVVDCELVGVNGPSGPEDDWWWGANGSSGVDVFDSRVWVSGGHGEGGHGGFGYSDYDPLFGVEECGNGGDGGSGVSVRAYDYLPVFAGPLASEVVVRGLAFEPGLGGGALCGVAGDDGQLVTVDDTLLHSVTLVPGEARSTWASSPVRGGSNARVYATGAPGDFCLALAGGAAPPLALPDQPLPLGVAFPAKVLTLGVVPAGGLLQKAFPTTAPAAGTGGGTLHLQGVVLPVGGLVLEAAPVGTLTLLEPVY